MVMRLRVEITTRARAAGQRAVVLIDEYDKPILDALEAPEVARANRDFLRGLYAVVKDCDAHIRFSFITGVSKFSKVSLFSGLNNLKGHHAESALLGTSPASCSRGSAPKTGSTPVKLLYKHQITDY